jgi:hypothetical protein
MKSLPAVVAGSFADRRRPPGQQPSDDVDAGAARTFACSAVSAPC